VKFLVLGLMYQAIPLVTGFCVLGLADLGCWEITEFRAGKFTLLPIYMFSYCTTPHVWPMLVEAGNGHKPAPKCRSLPVPWWPGCSSYEWTVEP
jgi:hypothetical protein